MARKKTVKTGSTAKSTAPLTAAPTPVAPVALLIDGENVTAPDLIAHILVEAGKLGGVTVRRVYGNWAAPAMQAWKKVLAHYALEWGALLLPQVRMRPISPWWLARWTCSGS